MKILCAFDFDDTIIIENSDYSVLNVLPDGMELPKYIQDLYSSRNWIEYMNQIFMYLKSIGISKKEILASIEVIPIMPGFKELIIRLAKNDNDIIIISDSNSVFIQHILKHNNLDSYFKEVFTNPAEFDKEGLLKVSGYHEQNWCDLSSDNLCKGHVLEQFIKKQHEVGVKYEYVAYVGDGNNDYCPSLRLSSNDYVFARKDFKLDRKIFENADKITAEVVRWKTGFDIITRLQSVLCQQSKNPGSKELLAS